MNLGFKSEDWLIAGLGSAVLIALVLTFIITPVYEAGASHIIDGLLGALTIAMGYKFGKSMPQQAGDPKIGQQTESTTTVKASSTLPSTLPTEVK